MHQSALCIGVHWHVMRVHWHVMRVHRDDESALGYASALGCMTVTSSLLLHLLLVLSLLEL